MPQKPHTNYTQKTLDQIQEFCGTIADATGDIASSITATEQSGYWTEQAREILDTIDLTKEDGKELLECLNEAESLRGDVYIAIERYDRSTSHVYDTANNIIHRHNKAKENKEG